ncbi:hypothetical protein AB3X82_15380 [Paraburkholderia phenoliruptrix]|uniref:BFN domain-containing protein n=1 Tax=Paraburkholderia phenoliruptrix TaxID=252970 RepID=A0ABV3W9L1_9BURK|nr:hypothetical protein [Paraburkholderia phenoliruptrix]MDR6387871.1 hypothetical protein [Paraburkholderia phenoliruptrix]
MKTLYGIAWHAKQRCAVFQIPTANFGTVFMRVSASPGDASVAVVEVDADRLLEQWRRTGGKPERCADASQALWPSDEKFAAAEIGFMEGQFDPVPLALMTCRAENGGSVQLSIADGVTRTIWLLTAGATIFPVSCPIDDACALQARAGAAGSRVRTTADLLSPASDEQYLKELRAAERMQARRILRDFAQSR